MPKDNWVELKELAVASAYDHRYLLMLSLSLERVLVDCKAGRSLGGVELHHLTLRSEQVLLVKEVVKKADPLFIRCTYIAHEDPTVLLPCTSPLLRLPCSHSRKEVAMVLLVERRAASKLLLFNVSIHRCA